MKLVEPAFGLDSFNKSNAYINMTALAKQILNFITMEPGTIPTCPTMGLGIGLYKMEFNSSSVHDEIRTNLMKQIGDFLPEYSKYVKDVVVERIPPEQLNGAFNGVYIGIITSEIDSNTGNSKILVFSNMLNSTANKVITSFSII